MVVVVSDVSGVKCGWAEAMPSPFPMSVLSGGDNIVDCWMEGNAGVAMVWVLAIEAKS